MVGSNRDSFPLFQFGEKPTTSNAKALNRLRALISLATKASASLRYTEQNKQASALHNAYAAEFELDLFMISNSKSKIISPYFAFFS